LSLIEHLKPWPVRVYDPVVPASVASHPAVTAAASALEAARGSDALMIMTPWPEFRTLVPGELAAAMAGKTVVDPFRVLDPAAVRAAGLTHFMLGVSTMVSGSAQ
jgi:UDPglucose 6-dehydrogenase